MMCPHCGESYDPFADRPIKFAGCSLSARTNVLSEPGRPDCQMTGVEGRILAALMRSAGDACSHDYLIGFCRDWETMPRTIAVHVFFMRRKLAGSRLQIVNSHGYGYRLRAVAGSYRAGADTGAAMELA